MNARPRLRDYVWGGIAILVGLVLAVGFVRAVVQMVAGDVNPLLGLAVIVVGSCALYWIAMGAWRRTIWGPPPPQPRQPAD